jgi:hypothetical protein
LLFAGAARAQSIGPLYASDYTLTNLGTISGLPTEYGPVVFKSGDPQTILIGGDADEDTAGIYEVTVTRDADGHITGFSGTAVKIANAPGTPTHGIDGGLAYGPDNVLFYTTYSDNQCGQIMPGSMNPDKLIDLTALGVSSSTGAIGFVPSGFAGAGHIKFTSFSDNRWYDATVAPDGAGTFDIVGLTERVTLPANNGPDGFAYVEAGHPSFTADSLVIVEYNADDVATYEIDSAGDPVAATRRVLADMTGSGPLSCAFDPITGDLLVSNYHSDDVCRIRGFLPPSCFEDADGDGATNCDDGCPDDGNKTQPGICGCGVPDDDTDGDGTPGCFDQCPDDPAKIAAGICGCGAPDTSDDGDGDGVIDCMDNCPTTVNADQADGDGNGVGDACELPPAGQPAGACGCGAGSILMMPAMLLGIGWTRWRTLRRQHAGSTSGHLS